MSQFNAVPIGTKPNDYFCTDLQAEKFFERFNQMIREEEEKKKITRPIQDKYLKHASQHRETQIFGVKKFMNLPACPRCERACLHDRKPGDPPKTFVKDEWGNLRPVVMVTCIHCGYHGPGGPPIKIAVQEV